MSARRPAPRRERGRLKGQRGTERVAFLSSAPRRSLPILSPRRRSGDKRQSREGGVRDATLSGATGRRRSLPTRRGERMTTPPPRVPCSQNTGNRAERETVAREEGTRPTQRQPDKREGREGSHFLTLPRPGVTGHGSRRRVASRVGGWRSASRRSAVGGRVSHLGGMGTRPRKEDLLQSEIHSNY